MEVDGEPTEVDMKDSSPVAENTDADDGWKSRRCKFVVMQEPCPFGEVCGYAHKPEEFRPVVEDITRFADHWQGDIVEIGVVEFMFWDIAPCGTLDVVCNRNTCLGNPFAVRVYGPGEVRPTPDENGWFAGEHDQLCAGFREYLSAVFDDSTPEDLTPVADRIAKARSLDLATTWVLQKVHKQTVRDALDALVQRMLAGERMRLLCHCRPHVQCHVEQLKSYLDKQIQSDDALVAQRNAARANLPKPPEAMLDALGCVWPGLMENAEKCVGRSRNWTCERDGRAADPKTLKMYCAQCWSQHAVDMKRWADQTYAEECAAAVAAKDAALVDEESAKRRIVDVAATGA